MAMLNNQMVYISNYEDVTNKNFGIFGWKVHWQIPMDSPSLQGHHDLRDQCEAPSEGALGGFVRAHATDHLGAASGTLCPIKSCFNPEKGGFSQEKI